MSRPARDTSQSGRSPGGNGGGRSRVRASVRAPYVILPEGWRLAASIGVSVTPHPTGYVGTRTLLRAADEAMYPDMKQSGVWYALHADYMGIAYNSERTTAQDEKFLHENGWDALTDPRWKGRCATVEPRRAEAHMLTTTCSWSG